MVIIDILEQEFYGEIPSGECFEYQNHLYFKTKINCKEDIIAVNLEDGLGGFFTPDTRVRPINVRIIVDYRN